MKNIDYAGLLTTTIMLFSGVTAALKDAVSELVKSFLDLIFGIAQTAGVLGLVVAIIGATAIILYCIINRVFFNPFE